jgi:hypothetical protein
MVRRNRRMLDYEDDVLYRSGMQLRRLRTTTQYTPPKLTELPSDKAKEFLRDQAAHGNAEAKELLNLLKQTSA